jgi:hypothetical protein
MFNSVTMRYSPFVAHLASEMPSAPTRVDQLPLAIVNAYSVPSMIRLECWYGLARLEWCVPKAFAVSRANKSLKASLECQSSKQASISLTYSQSTRDGLFGRGR